MPYTGQTTKPLVKLPRDPSACWTWLGATNAQGVAHKTVNHDTIPARRWLWETLFGPIPRGWVVYQDPDCQSKSCINPHHLRCGRQADANRVAVTTILSSIDAYEIAKAKDNAGPQTANELSAKYGCSANTVRDIWRGRTWRNRKGRSGFLKPIASPAPQEIHA